MTVLDRATAKSRRVPLLLSLLLPTFVGIASHGPMMLVPFPVRGFRATSGTGPGRYSVEVAR